MINERDKFIKYEYEKETTREKALRYKNKLLMLLDKGEEWLATKPLESRIFGLMTSGTFLVFTVYLWVKVQEIISSSEVDGLDRIGLRGLSLMTALVIIYWNWHIGYKFGKKKKS